MKNKPKKIAAYLELTRQELKYLLHGVDQAAKVFSCSRDYDEEDLHDKLKLKLDTALKSLE